MSRNGAPALFFHGVFLVFMLAPIAIVCVVAFTPEGYLSVPTTDWSLRWFRAIARYPEFIAAFWNSLALAAASSAIAVAFSVPAALAIARYRFPGRDALTALFLSPLMIPHVVLGIAFLRFFTQIGWSGTYPALVTAHVVLVFPFALRLTLAATTGADRSVEMAAVSLGAEGWTLFRRVMLPLILPAFFAGLGVVFIRSMTAISATIFLVSIDWTLITVKILENMTEVALGPAAAFSVFVIVVVLIVTSLLDTALRRMTAPSLRISRIGT